MDDDRKDLNSHPGTTAPCNSTANDMLGSVLQQEGNSYSDFYLQVQDCSIKASSFLKRGTEELQHAYFIPRETMLRNQAVTLSIL